MQHVPEELNKLIKQETRVQKLLPIIKNTTNSNYRKMYERAPTSQRYLHPITTVIDEISLQSEIKLGREWWHCKKFYFTEIHNTHYYITTFTTEMNN